MKTTVEYMQYNLEYGDYTFCVLTSSFPIEDPRLRYRYHQGPITDHALNVPIKAWRGMKLHQSFYLKLQY